MVRIKYAANRKIKEKVIQERFSSSESTEEEIPIPKYKKISSGITISEPVVKKIKTKESPSCQEEYLHTKVHSMVFLLEFEFWAIRVVYIPRMGKLYENQWGILPWLDWIVLWIFERDWEK